MTNLSPVPYKVVRGGSAEDAPPGSVPVNLFGVETGGGGGGEGLPEGSVGTWVGSSRLGDGTNYFKYTIHTDGTPTHTSFTYQFVGRVQDGVEVMGNWIKYVKVSPDVPSLPPGTELDDMAGTFSWPGIVSTPGTEGNRIDSVTAFYLTSEALESLTGFEDLEEGDYAVVMIRLTEEEASQGGGGILISITT